MTTAPKKIDTLITIDESELNKYPAPQRAIRRAQLERKKRSELEHAKALETLRNDMKKAAADFRAKLAPLGIDLPETDEPVASWQGYTFAYHVKQSTFHISKDVPNAKPIAEIPGEFFEYELDYRLTVSTDPLSLRFLEPADIANHLDTLDKRATEAEKNNALVWAQYEALTAKRAAPKAETPPSPQQEEVAALRKLAQAVLNPPKQEFKFVRFETGSISHRTFITQELARLVNEEGWLIEFETVEGGDYYARLSREKAADVTPPPAEKVGQDVPTNHTPPKAIEPARFASELAQSPATVAQELREILEEHDSITFEVKPYDQAAHFENLAQRMAAAPRAEFSNQRNRPDVLVIGGSALDDMLQGKPIAQAIASHGLDATRNALNWALQQNLAALQPEVF